MKLKPSCLKGMENMFGISKVEKFIDEKDNLSVEDTSGRVKIDKANSKIKLLKTFLLHLFIFKNLLTLPRYYDDLQGNLKKLI